MMKTVTKKMTAQHRVAQRSLPKGPVTAAYERKVEAGEVQRDYAQVALAAKLDALHESLAALPPVPMCTGHQKEGSTTSSGPRLLGRSLASAQSFLRKKLHLWSFGPSPRGIYIHGPVGVGKSFLMDLFYALVNAPDDDSCCKNNSHKQAKITKRRVHFHEFMLDVHHRIFVYKQEHPRDDAIPIVAQQLAQEAQLLCFDEFQVTDVADAMILKRLFLFLSYWNVVVVATSNRAPDALYEGGINRSLFLPFIDMLKHTFDIISMEDSQKDYRLESRADGQSYFWSNKDIHGDNSINNIQAQLEEIFGGTASTTKAESIPVLFGRTVQVARLNDRCAWFDFSELCYQPLGAADYLSLCRRFPVIIMERVPQLNANHLNEARRFVTLIDACYESRTRLVLAAQVPLDELFVDFEAQVESSDGDGELIVNDKGGNSSSFATTMIRTKEGKYYEWSATGRVGVSLAQFSSANDLAFSFRRAASRLVEMGGKGWGRQ
jgi:protein AFG1